MRGQKSNVDPVGNKKRRVNGVEKRRRKKRRESEYVVRDGK